jgi:riboflavin kinase/FMN adenylyltransferase
MYQVSGKIIKGDGYGKVLGFPTANLDRREYVRRKLKIKLGVWAGYAKIVASSMNQVLSMPLPKSFPSIGGEYKGWHKAGIVIGPIDIKGLPRIEAHLLNFKGNLYGKKIILSLGKYIRPYRKFSSVSILKQQIRKDLMVINKLL